MSKRKIDFSIIMPAYNAERHLKSSIQSIFPQEGENLSFEVLLIDDSSTDSTFAVAKKMEKKHPGIIKCYQTEKNSGPGEARNIGIQKASGEWLLFLDSDDKLTNNALVKLIDYIRINKSECYDIIGYNFRYDQDSEVKTSRHGRNDIVSLHKDKKELVKDSISLGMDGSVIYTLFRTELLNTHNIRFFSGLHEDVDFIFKAYYYAKNIGCLDAVVYLKNNRKESIVNTISEAHIDGYMRAYTEIYNFIKNKGLIDDFGVDYYIGLIGVVATRVREISSNNISCEKANVLYRQLYKCWLKISSQLSTIPYPELKTKYGMIADKFFDVMGKDKLADQDRWRILSDFIKMISTRSWSCYDLHNSIFLGPNEIRTCCKRFFKNGKMNGDVVLVEMDSAKPQPSLYNAIFEAKKNLYYKMNRGQFSECDGCPFLEFKDWGYLNKLKIENISFEYHSICNMRCKYCSEKYYGGEKPAYDLKKLVQDLISHNCLDDCKSIIWGGGEPVIDKSFNELVDLISLNAPAAKQRFISNAIIYSDKINDLLSRGKASLITSIDAGTEETFFKVRGVRKLNEVIENLKKYAKTKPNNIIIKYIIVDENKSVDELRLFAELMRENKLTGCNYQISFDFKKESVDFDSLTAIVMLFGFLTQAGCRLVFIDEHIRQRLRLDDVSHERLINYLSELKQENTIANCNKFDEVIVWGAGEQTKNLLEKSYFFQKVKIKYIVDNTPAKIGKKYLGYNVYQPEMLQESDIPVFISAVQSSPVIYSEYMKLGLDESRLINGLII